MGVDSVELSPPGDAWRHRRTFPASDTGLINGEREENVGIAQDVVIEKVLRAGAEVGDVEDPARERNRQSEFMLFIALAPQRQETESLLGGVVQQRTIHREQRRGLIVTSVEPTQDPVEARYSDSGPDPGIDRIFADGRTEMSEPHSAVDGQPTGELVLIFQKQRFHISPNQLALSERRIAAIAGDNSKELI